MTAAVSTTSSNMMPLTSKKVFRTQIGMFFFLATEVMFFASLLASFVVIKAGATAWPPAGQPRLPVGSTALNTAILLLSLPVLFISTRQSKQKSALQFPLGVFLATVMGMLFLLLQGHEWLELIRFGLATANSVYAGLFYVIVGAHALHVIGGLIMLVYLLSRLSKKSHGDLTPFVMASKMYWTMVVLLWPMIYAFLYF